MSEQIKTTTIDQLPEAASLDGLYVFGYASKNAVGKRSVKAPITLLKGNQGDIPTIGANGNWWISGKDTGLPSRGQDGNVTTEQLNQTIEEYMKTNTEKYDTAVIIQLNEEASRDKCSYQISKPASVSEIKVLHVVGEIEQQAIFSDFEAKGTTTRVALPSYGIGKIIANYLTGVSILNFTDLDAKSIDITTNKSLITQIQTLRCTMEAFICNGVESLQKYYSSTTNVTILDFRGCSKLTHMQTAWENKLTTVILDSKVLNSIILSNCTFLTDVRILSGSSDSIPLSTISLDGTAITKDSLLKIIDAAKSRVGNTTGSLKISKRSYDELTTEEKQLIVNKNFTIIV